MTGWAVLAGVGLAVAVLLAVPGRCAAGGQALPGPRSGGPGPGPGSERQGPGLRRHRLLLGLLAGCAGPTLLEGEVGLLAGLLLAGTCWVVLGRVEAPGVARARERARRALPHLVLLVAAALRSGAAPDRALGLAADALEGAAAARLAPALARLEVGVPAGEVWADLAADEVLGALGRTLERAHSGGAPVADAVERLADDLADAVRAGVEDRARAVGVRAALPLGLCLLPAFLLVGIVPVVAGLLAGLTGS